ncbi:MAG: PIN domain-containing protein [Victivallales bacterium]|nr:PIN domain-containing protein [Victivallales bacterium]
MKVLLDTNVVVTYLLKRQGTDLQECRKVVQLCAAKKIKGYVNLPTLATAWYLMRQQTDFQRRDGLRELCRLVELASTNMAAVRTAVDNCSFPDFEDNLQDCCAQGIQADYIVTANLKDYSHSVVPAVTPAELLALLQKSSVARYTRIGLPRRHWHALSTRTACRHIHTCWLPLAA